MLRTSSSAFGCERACRRRSFATVPYAMFVHALLSEMRLERMVPACGLVMVCYDGIMAEIIWKGIGRQGSFRNSVSSFPHLDPLLLCTCHHPDTNQHSMHVQRIRFWQQRTCKVLALLVLRILPQAVVAPKFSLMDRVLAENIDAPCIRLFPFAFAMHVLDLSILHLGALRESC